MVFFVIFMSYNMQVQIFPVLACFFMLKSMVIE
jgi:hypothetical protein